MVGGGGGGGGERHLKVAFINRYKIYYKYFGI